MILQLGTVHIPDTEAACSGGVDQQGILPADWKPMECARRGSVPPELQPLADLTHAHSYLPPSKLIEEVGLFPIRMLMRPTSNSRSFVIPSPVIALTRSTG